MEKSKFKFVTSQTIFENNTWKHVLSDKTLYIIDSDGKCVCTIKGKEQLLELCTSLGIVGTGVRL